MVNFKNTCLRRDYFCYYKYILQNSRSYKHCSDQRINRRDWTPLTWAAYRFRELLLLLHKANSRPWVDCRRKVLCTLLTCLLACAVQGGGLNTRQTENRGRWRTENQREKEERGRERDNTRWLTLYNPQKPLATVRSHVLAVRLHYTLLVSRCFYFYNVFI